MRITNKKRISVVAGGLAAALIGGGVAFAYWTTGGTGAGSAGVGTTQNVAVTQTTPLPTGLFPGGPAQNISYTITNSNPGPVFIGSVAVSVGSVTKDPAAPAGTCDATDFSFTQPTAVNANIPVGPTPYVNAATISMVNKPAANQNACKNATVNLTFTVS